MTVLTENVKANRIPNLRVCREELSLYQDEARFFCRIIRKAIISSEMADQQRLSQLLSRMVDFYQETLPTLQKALQSLDGQTANTTKADSGMSQAELFGEGLEEARQKLNIMKREAFSELSEDFMRARIW
ncbi:MAG: hypothetical protein KDC66_10920 [Phaeodactylibacter sp.]|nr:hypothetical protein [Phaeodactylibacter sp.]MCB9276308.1 hypothetical protein [Lewinellaceae bacterium]